MKNLQIEFSSQILAVLLLFSRVKSKKICQSGQQDITTQPFDLTARDISRLRNNVISESRVRNLILCGSSCLATRFCVAYNYKENSNETEINCQLSQTSSHRFEKVSTEDNDWMFYEAVGKRKSGCEEENECLNGGKMVWDPEKPFKCEYPVKYSGGLCEKMFHVLDSNILSAERPEFTKILAEWLPMTGNWSICWRATRDGWESGIFHQRCDLKIPTLTVVKVVKNNKTFLFGGYATAQWGGDGFTHAPGSFLFSLRNNDDLPPFKSPLYRFHNNAILRNNDCGPTFGNGPDLSIACNFIWKSNANYANLGYTYKAPSGYSKGDTKTQLLLAGSMKFTPAEVEVLYFT